jgi:LysM repeat protein
MVVFLAIFFECRQPRDVGSVPPGVYHTVKPHQTFWRICKTYGVEMEEGARINSIKDKSKREVGHRIFIPGRHDGPVGRYLC